jgi:hypothetical protein
MSVPSNTSTSGYDIQGQLKNSSDISTSVPTGNITYDYTALSTYDDGRITSDTENMIPATAPGLQDPVVPGKVKTEAQKADLDVIGADPLNSAINANAEALKSAGIVTVSQADVNEEVLSKGVLGAVPGGN